MDLIPGLHAHEVRRIIDIGLSVEVDTLWTYAQMAEQMGREVVGNDSALQKALARLSRDHGVEFKNVRKIGYIRLSDQGIVDQSGGDRVGITRKVRRVSQRSANIQNFDALTDSLKLEVNAHRTVLALMREIVKPSAVRRVKQEVDRARTELDIDSTLALFRRSQG